MIDLHHHGIFQHPVSSDGLKVALDLQAKTVTVTAGFYELPAELEWVRNHPQVGNRWQVPVDVTLPLPSPTDPQLPCPYLCLGFNEMTGKAGIYIAHLGELQPPLHVVEYLAVWQWREKRWAVRHLYDAKGSCHFGGISTAQEMPPRPWMGSTKAQ